MTEDFLQLIPRRARRAFSPLIGPGGTSGPPRPACPPTQARLIVGWSGSRSRGTSARASPRLLSGQTRPTGPGAAPLPPLRARGVTLPRRRSENGTQTRVSGSPRCARGMTRPGRRRQKGRQARASGSPVSAVSTTRLIAAASITSSLAISDVPKNNWSICILVALLVATAYNEILLFVAQTT